MTELQSIKNQRAGHRGFVNKVIKKINDVLSDDIIVDLNDNISKLRSYQTTLRQKSETLQKLHADALALITEDKSIEDEIEKVSEFEMNLQEYIIKVDQWLRSCEPDKKDDDKPHISITRNSAKLPKFELKRFDGDPLEWHMFWDTFKSAIDKNKSLDNVTKFNYLKGVLDGKAAAGAYTGFVCGF